ncbi:MAG: hypothetical protein ACXABY_03345 [Candidatus Thorarchaeota archaeon]|jgi:hypothetical protein
MKYSKPLDWDVSLSFPCTDCPNIWYATLEQMKEQGWSFFCTTCNKIIQVKPIREVKFVYEGGSRSRQSEIPRQTKRNVFEQHEDAVQLLLALGCTKTDAKQKIYHFVKTTGFVGSTDELTKKILENWQIS